MILSKFLSKKIKSYLKPAYYIIIKILLPKSLLLNKYGLVAIGERNRMFKNPRWVTLDIVGNPDFKLDLESISKGLPFKSESLRSIYSSHNLEHISLKSAKLFFSEARRILKKGGELLLDVPCAETIYKLIGTYINDPNDKKLNRFLKSFKISDYEFKLTHATCPSNKDVPKEWINHPVNQLSQLIACYVNGIDDNHLAVINNPNEVIKAYKDLDMEDFFEFLFNQLPNGMRYSGGHCEAWYPKKIYKILEKEGFEIVFRFSGESQILEKDMVPDKNVPSRDAYSFKVSAIKVD